MYIILKSILVYNYYNLYTYKGQSEISKFFPDSNSDFVENFHTMFTLYSYRNT